MKYRVCLFIVCTISLVASDTQSNRVSPSKFHSNTLDVATLQNIIFLLTHNIEDKKDQIKDLNAQIKDLSVGYQTLTTAYWERRQENKRILSENKVLQLCIVRQNQAIDLYKSLSEKS